MQPDSDEDVQEKKNPIKRAEKEKEFRTVGGSKEILQKPEELYEAALKYNKTFKTV